MSAHLFTNATSSCSRIVFRTPLPWRSVVIKLSLFEKVVCLERMEQCFHLNSENAALFWQSFDWMKCGRINNIDVEIFSRFPQIVATPAAESKSQRH
jgi:hypothetical protein